MKSVDDENFLFLGTFPSNFNKKNTDSTCMYHSLCSLDLQNLFDKKITKLGVVFNFDERNQPGSHWVAVYICLDKKTAGGNFGVYYFDSEINAIPLNIHKFIFQIYKRGQAIWSDFELVQNKVLHQKQTSECGVYSLYIIIKCISGSNFKRLVKRRIPDEFVFNKRNILWKPNNFC
jgi:hypothetical protein